MVNKEVSIRQLSWPILRNVIETYPEEAEGKHEIQFEVILTVHRR